MQGPLTGSPQWNVRVQENTLPPLWGEGGRTAHARNENNGLVSQGGTPFPNLNDELDPDDLTPEESVTKQIWKVMYCGREMQRRHDK